MRAETARMKEMASLGGGCWRMRGAQVVVVNVTSSSAQEKRVGDNVPANGGGGGGLGRPAFQIYRTLIFSNSFRLGSLENYEPSW